MPEDDTPYKSCLDNLYDGVYFLDPNRKITYWNKAAERLTGYRADEVLGTCCKDNVLMHVDAGGICLCDRSCPAAETLADGQLRQADVFLHHKDGHRIPVSVRVAPIHGTNNEIMGAIQIFSDDSPKAAMAQRIEELRKLALYDPLTGLGNRRYGEMFLQTRFEEMRRYDWPFGIFFIDIDHFKRVNDVHGHDVGDKVLAMVAKTLAANVRSFDVVTRWGGRGVRWHHHEHRGRRSLHPGREASGSGGAVQSHPGVGRAPGDGLHRRH